MELTIAQKFEAAESTIAELSAKVERLTADKTAAETLATEAQGLLTLQAETSQQLAAQLDATRADWEKAQFDRDAAKAEADKVAKELADLRATVATNPAFAHAAAGRAPVSEPAETSSDLWAEYNALQSPVARAEFWAKHSATLRKLAR